VEVLESATIRSELHKRSSEDSHWEPSKLVLRFSITVARSLVSQLVSGRSCQEPGSRAGSIVIAG
jgi:hypothetical protein